MRCTRQRWGGVLLALAASLLLACDHDALDPALARGSGRYTLVTVGGTGVPYPEGVPGPVSGVFILERTGTFEQRITYRTVTSALSEDVFTGTYSVSGSRLELAFEARLDNGETYVWRRSAIIAGDTITFTRPHPADGPDIVEKYVR